MTKTLLCCAGGTVALPAADLVLLDAADGGNLIVHAPREVWERSELLPTELALWSFLVAATECGAIVSRAATLLRERYELRLDQVSPVGVCVERGYPTPCEPGEESVRCSECRP